jgi:uncharacterized damage-inducible protein DinB
VNNLNKNIFFNALLDEHARWIKVIESLEPEKLGEPGVAGTWSIKDIIAHISWYEREIIPLIQQHRLTGSPLWNLSTDERNAAIFEIVHDHPVKEVLEESKAVFNELVEAVKTLSTEDLNNPSHFAGMPADWIPLQIIAGNSYEHYRQHFPDVINRFNKNSKNN